MDLNHGKVSVRAEALEAQVPFFSDLLSVDDW